MPGRLGGAARRGDGVGGSRRQRCATRSSSSRAGRSRRTAPHRKVRRCNIGPVYVCNDGPVFTAEELAKLPQEYWRVPFPGTAPRGVTVACFRWHDRFGMTRALSVALVLLLASGCASGGSSDAALVEAGRLRRLEQPPPSAAELRGEVAAFLDAEIPLMREKAKRSLDSEKRLWRGIAVGGAALGVLAATSGSISDSSSGVQAGLTALGLTAALGGWALYAVRTKDLKACVSFLDESRRDIVTWQANALPPAGGSVSPEVYRDWVNRVAAIRGHDTCQRTR